MDSLWLWTAFNVFVLAMLAVDLGIFHRRAHVVSVREAALWTGVWITLALTFNLGVWYFEGSQHALEFLTGYLIEKSLSVDNIFVFVIIFSYFSVPAKYQHRVLFWGILGALVMRGTLIGAGTYLVEHFDWVMYVFGGFLVLTAVRMAFKHGSTVEPEHNPVLKLLRRLVPVTNEYRGQAFFVKENDPRSGRPRWFVTPLLVVLVVVETSDLVFAVDSIPAIFAVTREPFLVYTSNVFAILGLRALYFLLAGIIDRFTYLSYGLALVLGFVGVKMLIEDWVHIPIGISLAVVGAILFTTGVISYIVTRHRNGADAIDSTPVPRDAETGVESGDRQAGVP